MKPLYITKHGEERLLGRMGTSKEKLLKICRKAWVSKTQIPTLVRKQYGYEKGGGTETTGRREFRAFAGYVFVFAEEERAVKLITVIDPRESRLPY